MSSEVASYRGDIEGLRAIAVGVVFVSHLVGLPGGGFVGVDIFFVISGFLITGLLIREYERSGQISFREFYARRARRILPAALLVLLATCIAARAVFFDARANQTYVDSFWAAISLANWHMAAIGTDYFQSTLPPSIVQQYWSLSVEEQFYLVWPVVLVLVGLFTIHRKMPFRAALAATMGMVILSSLLWALWQTPRATTVAYFSTFARGWELGIGALLAIAAGQLSRLPRWGSQILIWAGLTLVVCSVVLTRADNTFPAPGALPATLGTAAVIAGGCSASAPVNHILVNPVFRFIGLISYSLYLWHWPVIIITEVLIDKGSWQQITTAVVVSLTLSTASFYAIEQPIRRTTFLSRMPAGKKHRGLPQRVRRGYAAVLAVTAVGFTVSAAMPSEIPGAELPPVWPSKATTAENAGDQTPTDWAQEVQSAVLTTEWPTLSPSLDQLATARVAEWKACANVGPETETQCRFGDTNAERSLVVLGDSVAISWIPAMRAAYETKGWRIQGLTFGECPAARIDVESSSRDQGFTAACRAHQEYAVARAVSLEPTIVVVSTTDAVLGRVVSGDRGAAASILRTAETTVLRQLKESGAHVVVLSPPPIRQDLQECASRLSVPSDCLSSVSGQWRALEQIDRAATAEAGVSYIDTKEWTCTPSDDCPGFVAGTPVMADGIHLTDAISRKLGPLVLESIEGTREE